MRKLVQSTNFIPVAMLAHNEEDIIAQSLHSILQQRLPQNVSFKIYVFTNGCTDRTEEIVSEIAKYEPRVQLISVSTKGKVPALRHSVRYFQHLRRTTKDKLIDRVIYVDADIEMTSRETFWHLSKKLDSNEELYLVSSFPIMSKAEEPGWLVRSLFRAKEYLQLQFQNNVVRGACYIIDFGVLERLDYPDDIVSDDMFLEVRLNGHTLMDYEHPVLAQPKNTLKAEVQRDLFTVLARNQIYLLKREGKITSLDPETMHPELSLSWFSPGQCVTRLVRHCKFRSLALICCWNLVHRYNCHRAKKMAAKHQSLSGAELLGLWSTER